MPNQPPNPSTPPQIRQHHSSIKMKKRKKGTWQLRFVKLDGILEKEARLPESIYL